MNLKKITLVTLLIILFSSCAPYSLPEKEPVVQRDNAFTFYSLALEQFKAQEYELAITSLNRAIQINPNFFQFHQLAGDIHAARADYDAALRAYNLALTQRSNSPDIYQRMAAIREMQKRYPEAINLHRRALTSGSGDDEVYLNIAADYLLIEETGPALGALQDYQRVVAGRDGQLSERYYLLHADVLQRRKNFTAALIELENISQPVQDELRYHQLMGENQYGLGAYEKGVSHFSRLIQLDGKNSQWYLMRGLYFYQKKDWEDAEQHFRLAISLNAQNADAHYYLGKVLLATNQPAEALETLREFRALAVDQQRLAEVDMLISDLEKQGRQQHGP